MTRAREPDAAGVVERDGVRVAWERFGEGDPPILFMPTWSIVHSRIWKLQVPDFARRHRVITFDPRGNGGSSRPIVADAYAETEFAADALAVLDATGTERAVVVALSLGAQRSLHLAADHPERVAGVVFIGASIGLGRLDMARMWADFDEPRERYEGWETYNQHYWRSDYRGFLEFFFGQCFSESHSTKPLEDAIGWGLETDPETLIASQRGPRVRDRERTIQLARSVRCPVLVIHGDDDRVRPHAQSAELAELTGGQLVTIGGGGHIPNARDPIKVNLLIREFVASVAAGGAGSAAPSAAKPAAEPRVVRRASSAA